VVIQQQKEFDFTLFVARLYVARAVLRRSAFVSVALLSVLTLSIASFVSAARQARIAVRHVRA
jgi:hypothetical protein